MISWTFMAISKEDFGGLIAIFSRRAFTEEDKMMVTSCQAGRLFRFEYEGCQGVLIGHNVHNFELTDEIRSHFGSSHFGSSHFGSSHFGSSNSAFFCVRGVG